MICDTCSHDARTWWVGRPPLAGPLTMRELCARCADKARKSGCIVSDAEKGRRERKEMEDGR